MRFMLFVMMAILALPLAAYQDAGFTIFSPTALSEGEGELSIFHRFQGPVDEDVWNSLFGLNSGANVGLGYRRSFPHYLEAKASYTRAKKRVELGASWRPAPENSLVAAQLDVAWFSFAETGIEERRNNFFLLASAQNGYQSRYAVLTVNAGYDAYYERVFSGAALHLKLNEDIAVVGEYYPVWDRESAPPDLRARMGDHDAYAFGLKFGTWGHHFIFSLSNSWQSHPTTMSLGANSSDLYLGFNIHRRF